MYDPNLNAAPFNKMPTAVLIAIGLIGVLELFFQGANSGIVQNVDGVALRNRWIHLFGFHMGHIETMWITSEVNINGLYQAFTFNFVQRNLPSALIGLALFAALGKYVAERRGQLCFVATLLLAPLFGLICYVFISPPLGPIVGIFPAVFGLIGGFTIEQIERRREDDEPILPAFSLITFLMMVQLIYFFLFGTSTEWIAEFFAFVAGCGIALIIGDQNEGRRRKILQKIRSR